MSSRKRNISPNGPTEKRRKLFGEQNLLINQNLTEKENVDSITDKELGEISFSDTEKQNDPPEALNLTDISKGTVKEKINENKKNDKENVEHITDEEIAEISFSDTENQNDSIDDLFLNFPFDDTETVNDPPEAFQICKVISVKNSDIKVVNKNGNTYDLILCHNWKDTQVEVNDQIHLYKPEICGNQIKIQIPDSHIVVYPYWLISCSKLSGFKFCARQSVLNEYLPVEGNKSMIVGSIVHYLFERSIYENNSMKDLNKYLQEYLNDKQIILKLYEADINVSELKKNVQEYYTNIIEWKNRNRNAVCVETEENLYSLRYGLRGNIDLTMKDPHTNTFYPLELKTGLASDLHEMQILGYQLLLSDCKQTDLMDGLILYLKDYREKKIIANESHANSLIDTRNGMATSLENFNIDIEDIPEQINSERACGKCQQIQTCSLLSKPSSSKIYLTQIAHLNEEMKQFFLDYFQLVMKEFSTNQSSYVYRNISRKESTNGGIRGAKFDKCIQNKDKWTYYFSVENYKTLKHSLNDNDYVFISNDDGSFLQCLTGFIQLSDKNNESSQIMLICNKKYNMSADENVLFRIDKIGFISPMKSSLYCLTNLMSNSDLGSILRQVIITEKCFHQSKIVSQEYENRNLNKHQKNVINEIISGGLFHLVKGYPGTGKTITIKHLVEHYVSCGKRVLVTSYTHSAVQNIIGKIDENIRCLYVDVANSRNVQGNISNRTLSSFMQDITDKDQISEQLKSINVFGVTCLSMGHPILSKLSFDLIIIDEAGQITLPISLYPLLHLKYDSHNQGQFVLFGDTQQLPPLLTNEQIRDGELSISLFERLCTRHPNLVFELKYQYRMNSRILEVIEVINNNLLICGSKDVANFAIEKLPNYNNVPTNSDYLRSCSSGAIKDSVIMLDVNDADKEIKLIKDIVNHLNECGISDDDVGIISPFNSSVNAIKNALVEDRKIEIDTIDKFQGRDKFIVIVSFSKNTKDDFNSKRLAILSDKRRLNVCLTRCKCKLILLGHWSDLVKNYEILNRIRQQIDRDQYFQIC